MDIKFPTQEFMMAGAGIAAVLMCVVVIVFKNNFRVNGAVSWVLLMVMAPVPVILGMPAAGLVALNTEAALPVVGLTVALGLAWVHLFMPSIIPDFQTDGFTASAIGAVAIGLAAFIAGNVTGSFPQGNLFGEEQRVFQDRSAGALEDLGL